MKAKHKVAVVGIAGIVIIESVALCQGVNGVMLSAAIGTIAAIVGGIGGFTIGVNSTK